MSLHNCIFVYTYLGREVVLCGQFSHRDGVGRFSYEEGYLKNPEAHPLDPEHLPLNPAVKVTNAEGGFFGAFLDCCPQEWGQQVMRLIASEIVPENERESMFAEGLADPLSMMIYGSGYGTGSLRFSPTPGSTDLELEPDCGDLPMNNLAKMRQLAEVLARVVDNRPLTPEESAILVPGMSLGGARPKALVTDGDDLWIAKFYRAREAFDIQRVEYVVNQMASKAGINVAESRIEPIHVDGVDRTIFLSKRFDRRHGAPVHYISAATVLGAPRTTGAIDGIKVDVSQAQGKYGYADIAFALRNMSSAVRDDLHQLFRRMVFNVMVGNRDDHLCNHGFLLDEVGPYYRLSPAFDLAITPTQPALHPINVGTERGRVGTISNVLSAAGEFNLRREQALDIVREVGSVVSQWPRFMATHEVTPFDVQWVRGLMMEGIEGKIAAAESNRQGPAGRKPQGLGLMR